MFQVSFSLSMKTGFAPQYLAALAVAIYVSVGIMTSSPSPTPSASSARCSVTVPLQQASAYLVPQKAANSF